MERGPVGFKGLVVKILQLIRPMNEAGPFDLRSPARKEHLSHARLKLLNLNSKNKENNLQILALQHINKYTNEFLIIPEKKERSYE